ncbi:MAG: hypothetical protein JW743_10590 [Deltaproteobacteria bacterium]|nr:hypothetical protein [Deltaproteobacteria bacterium]
MPGKRKHLFSEKREELQVKIRCGEWLQELCVITASPYDYEAGYGDFLNLQ